MCIRPLIRRCSYATAAPQSVLVIGLIKRLIIKQVPPFSHTPPPWKRYPPLEVIPPLLPLEVIPPLLPGLLSVPWRPINRSLGVWNRGGGRRGPFSPRKGRFHGVNAMKQQVPDQNSRFLTKPKACITHSSAVLT